MKKIVLGTTLVLVGIALYTSLALAAETSPLANAIAKQLDMDKGTRLCHP